MAQLLQSLPPRARRLFAATWGVAILLGYFCYSGELALLLYAAAWALAIQAFIVSVEEPGLRDRFGQAYVEYTRGVPRWVGPVARPARRGD